MTWEDERNNRYIFKNVVDGCEVKNINRIHPLQQKNVAEIVKNLEGQKIKITVIGSSLNLRCNIFSDLDIVVDATESKLSKSEIEKKILGCTRNVDILWTDFISDGDRICDEIRKGVVVLE